MVTVSGRRGADGVSGAEGQKAIRRLREARERGPARTVDHGCGSIERKRWKERSRVRVVACGATARDARSVRAAQRGAAGVRQGSVGGAAAASAQGGGPRGAVRRRSGSPAESRGKRRRHAASAPPALGTPPTATLCLVAPHQKVLSLRDLPECGGLPFLNARGAAAAARCCPRRRSRCAHRP